MYDRSSDETTQLILETLLTLVNSPKGARKFLAVDDLSCLIEIAPAQPLVLDLFLHAFTQSTISVKETSSLSSRIDSTIKALAVSFKGTDGVTLLNFVDRLLRRLDPEVCCRPRIKGSPV